MKGCLTKEDILTLPGDLRYEAKKLKPGYIAISDVSEYEPASGDNLEILSKTMAAAVETKMGATIRIVSMASATDLQQISSSRHGYKAIICSSKAENMAEKIEKEKLT